MFKYPCQGRRFRFHDYIVVVVLYFLLLPVYAADDRKYTDIVAQSGYISFRSADGFKVYGRLFGPAHIERPLPVIIELHGGPHNNFSNTPAYIYKSLTDAGFLVLAVNYRGSRGYDSEYFNKVVGDVGRGDVEDVAAAARELCKFSFVQKDKIFVLGHSYGGYLVYMTISKYPDLFRGAIAMSGPVDLKEQLKLLKQNVGLGKVPASVLEEMLSDLKGRELALDASPITLIHKVDNPILIIHGLKDDYCPIKPVQNYADKLRSLKPNLVDTWYLPNYGHDLGIYTQSKHADEVLSKITNWLNTHSDFL